MKVKRFNNLWSMGLIICGALLVFFYVAKLFFPQFIVGIAEVPSIVAFGKFVDSHLWATLLFHIVSTFTCGYIYCCACCKTKMLTKKQTLIFLSFGLFSIVLQFVAIDIYIPYNYVMFVLVPFLLNIIEHKSSAETFASTSICFTVDIMTQAFSMAIRNITVMTTSVNSATMTILLIDAWIWRILLYLYFNNKGGK